jgi:hypothetical protein
VSFHSHFLIAPPEMIREKQFGCAVLNKEQATSQLVSTACRLSDQLLVDCQTNCLTNKKVSVP